MNLDHPTSSLFFVYAFTFCRVDVYTRNLPFARFVLFEAIGLEELQENDSANGWTTLDTRLFLHLIQEALPKILAKATPAPRFDLSTILGKID